MQPATSIPVSAQHKEIRQGVRLIQRARAAGHDVTVDACRLPGSLTPYAVIVVISARSLSASGRVDRSAAVVISFRKPRGVGRRYVSVTSTPDYRRTSTRGFRDAFAALDYVDHTGDWQVIP